MPLKPKTLVCISTHPAESPRPAEGIRIAAGIGAWKKTDVTLLLRGPAAYSLTEYVDEYIDEDNFSRYLPIVAEFGRPIYVESSFQDLDALEGSQWKYEVIQPQQVAELFGEHQHVFQF
ncbi:MAG: hypothetical protein ACAI35_05945 [Candidatus Methylacidiphilales bacterium]|nr:hypothetical protein [Candidatus Methylacidiphilales bacterium]